MPVLNDASLTEARSHLLSRVVPTVAKRNPTLGHLFGGAGMAANVSGLATEMPRPTLYRLTVGTDFGGWERIAERVLQQASDGALWFPDSNVKIDPKTRCFWDAAQTAYASTFRRQVVFSRPILNELEEWLTDPRDRHELAREIQSCLSGNVGFAKAAEMNVVPSSLAFAFNSYLYMSTMRRYLALPADDGTMLDGLDRSNLSLIMSKIIDRFGHREQLLARAGLNDVKKDGAINIADEAHVVLAFFYSLLTETSVCILTTDKHLFEIFFKLQAIVDNHYRCYLAADLVAAGLYGEPELVAPGRTDGYFVGQCEMYKKRTVHLDEVMRERRKYFTIEVALVEHDGRVNYL